jgi:phage-related protein
MSGISGSRRLSDRQYARAALSPTKQTFARRIPERISDGRTKDLLGVGKYANMRPMRRVSWLKAALREFSSFPQPVQDRVKGALAIAAAGSMADTAKPMKGFDVGVYEISVAYRSDAFRAVYAVKLGADIWVVHAFQKKSTQGIKTPKREIDVIKERIKRLREALR